MTLILLVKHYARARELMRMLDCDLDDALAYLAAIESIGSAPIRVIYSPTREFAC